MAIVQCELTDTSEGTPRREEMACLLRNINGTWLVFGIAYGTAPGKPGILTNFETGQNSPVSPNVMTNQMAGNQGNGGQQGSGNASQRRRTASDASRWTAASRSSEC